MSNVIVVAVHPDDETLGAGGALFRHKFLGDKIYWLLVTSIEASDKYSREFVSKRKEEIKQVMNEYGFDGVFELKFTSSQIDRYPLEEVISKISEVFIRVRPTIVYLPFKNDVHSDHRIVFNAAISCTKSFRYDFIEEILMMETLSETEFTPSLFDSFIPNYFVDITSFFEKKMKVVKIYESEIKPHPFPRSVDNIKALAIFRGASCGTKYAESFMMLKKICR